MTRDTLCCYDQKKMVLNFVLVSQLCDEGRLAKLSVSCCRRRSLRGRAISVFPMQLNTDNAQRDSDWLHVRTRMTQFNDKPFIVVVVIALLLSSWFQSKAVDTCADRPSELSSNQQYLLSKHTLYWLLIFPGTPLQFIRVATTSRIMDNHSNYLYDQYLRRQLPDANLR